MTGGYVGQRFGSYMAPGNRASAIWLRKLEHKISELTAKCQSPQSCFPVSKGISLVEGKENFKRVGKEELEWSLVRMSRTRRG